MRDINRAERLLSLFTSPDNAAGITGDLSEERDQRGRLWFWRQVLGTALFLCRGALFESPVVVLSLVAWGFVMLLVSAIGVSAAEMYLIGMLPMAESTLDGFLAVSLAFSIHAILGWSGALISGATLVATAPRLGMVACVLLAGIYAMLSLAIARLVLANTSTYWLLVWIPDLVAPAFPLLGGALIRRRHIGRQLRTA